MVFTGTAQTGKVISQEKSMEVTNNGKERSTPLRLARGETLDSHVSDR